MSFRCYRWLAAPSDVRHSWTFWLYHALWRFYRRLQELAARVPLVGGLFARQLRRAGVAVDEDNDITTTQSTTATAASTSTSTTTTDDALTSPTDAAASCDAAALDDVLAALDACEQLDATQLRRIARRTHALLERQRARVVELDASRRAASQAYDAEQLLRQSAEQSATLLERELERVRARATLLADQLHAREVQLARLSATMTPARVGRATRRDDDGNDNVESGSNERKFDNDNKNNDNNNIDGNNNDNNNNYIERIDDD